MPLLQAFPFQPSVSPRPVSPGQARPLKVGVQGVCEWKTPALGTTTCGTALTLAEPRRHKTFRIAPARLQLRLLQRLVGAATVEEHLRPRSRSSWSVSRMSERSLITRWEDPCGVWAALSGQPYTIESLSDQRSHAEINSGHGFSHFGWLEHIAVILGPGSFARMLGSVG